MRELAFKLLFEQAISGSSMDEIISCYEDLNEESAEKFTKELALGTEEKRDIIDEAINKHSKTWRVDRLSKVSVSVLRLAVYEMMFEEKIPVSVSINEAVEIAKTYGDNDDAPYVNGVLSGIEKDKSIVSDKSE